MIVSVLAVVVTAAVDQKSVGMVLAWSALAFGVALLFLILASRPGWVLSASAIAAFTVASLGPISLISGVFAPSFSYATVNAFVPIGAYGFVALAMVGVMAWVKALFTRKAD